VQHTHPELAGLADHLAAQREAMLLTWQNAIRVDPLLAPGHALPRAQLLDHIPLLLATFEEELHRLAAGNATVDQAKEQRAGAAHGLERWKQGYDLREVARELGMLNECVVAELDRFSILNPGLSHTGISAARRIWARLCRTDIEASIAEYFSLQQEEATGQVRELEQALKDIVDLEHQRGELWRQAAHDLRGNLGVVANVTAGLRRHGNEASRIEFVRILMRNLTVFHHLIDDVTSLARLQAGQERVIIEPLDAATTIQQLCEGMRPLAEERQLYLRCEGPPTLAVDGDAVKIRRIAQNLILNALKYTKDGGVTVTWGDSEEKDSERWRLCIKDTGPGLTIGADGTPHGKAAVTAESITTAEKSIESHWERGEGIGLSIVKRLCEMFDATVEIRSVHNTGTTFCILFPRRYDA
jgi:signal transduction histidine kinase